MSHNRKIEAIYPLSPLQRGILFHNLYAPESGLYFEQALLAIQGELNATAFEQAWHEVAARRDILRTLFVWEGHEKPLQVVVERVKIPFQQHDWRDSTWSDQQGRLGTFLEEDSRLGFDLTRPPLVRLALIRVEDNRYEFVWSFHHLLLDGWSMWFLIGEVFACYEALNNSRPLSLQPARSYQDYISWLQKQDLFAAETYWRRTLKGFTTPTRLGVERALQTGAAADYLEQELRLPEEMTSQLQSLARRNKLTLNTLVQGAWALLLSRYSGETDIVYGVIVSGRPANLTGAESIAGLFINTLPMRATFFPDESALSWLTRFQDQMAEMSQYEYSPLVEVQGWSDVARGVQLFDTLFAFQNYPMDTYLVGGGGEVNARLIRVIEKTNYPITLMAVPGTGLTLKIMYESRRFDTDVIKRLLGSLSTLLEGMLSNIESRLSELPFLTEAERNQLLDCLPVAINGKLDRQALPDPDHSTPQLRQDYIAPRTRVEKMVADIWAEVLNLDLIGVHNSFFELGGNSLLAMRVASRIYKAFKVDISLRDFFNAPTVADLGMTILVGHAESQDREKVAQALAGLE